ncbi:MAG: DsbA family protein, partial [Pseudomonadota bacterium]
EDIGELSYRLLQAVWSRELDISDDAVLCQIAGEAGLDGASLLKQSERYSLQVEKACARALDAGLFGAPTYLVEGEVFWGQDRLDFVDRALASLESQ